MFSQFNAYDYQDLQQSILLRNIKDFLQEQFTQEDEVEPCPDPAYRQEIIEWLDESKGHCFGLATMFSYCAWLQTQPIRYDDLGMPIPRDDLVWFQAMTQLFAGLSDEETNIDNLSNKQIKQMHRFIAIMLGIQKSLQLYIFDNTYLDSRLHDTHGRHFTNEYTLAGLLTAYDLYAPRNYCLNSTIVESSLLKLLIHPGKMIFITSYMHASALFHNGEEILYFDANCSDGIEHFRMDEMAELACHIFSTHYRDLQFPLPLSFQIASHQQTPARYPQQANVLSQTLAAQTPQTLAIAIDDYSVLHHTVRFNCVESTRFYLQAGVNPNAFITKNHTKNASCLLLAIIRQNLALVELLLAYGANANLSGPDPFSYLQSAVLLNNIVITKILLQHGANVNEINTQDGYTALCYAAEQNNVAIVRLLMDHDANIEIRTKAGKTALNLTTNNEIFALLFHANMVREAPTFKLIDRSRLLLPLNYSPQLFSAPVPTRGNLKPVTKNPTAFLPK